MSLTKNTITDNTIREKANLIIKSAKHSGISFTNEERILIRERFRKRLDMWITANNDIGDINKDRMIENLEKWSSEISCNYTIGWTCLLYTSSSRLLPLPTLPGLMRYLAKACAQSG